LWYRWIEEINAVVLVPVSFRGWQWWRGAGESKWGLEYWTFAVFLSSFFVVCVFGCTPGDGGGGGWMHLIPLDRREQGGSSGTGLISGVAVVAGWQTVKVKSIQCFFFRVSPVYLSSFTTLYKYL
jgi:hypothetical protein